MQKVILFVLGIATILPVAAQEAGWEQIGQAAWPYRPSVGEIVRTSGGDLLACPFGDGLYRSTGEGAAWTPVGIAENLPECALVVADDGALFAGTEGGVYRSDDGGTSWMLVGLERWIYDLEQGPDGRLWAIAHKGDFDRALFRSGDGMAWTMVADEVSIGADFVGRFEAVALAPEGIVFLSARYGLFRSVDDGATWEETEIDSTLPGTVPSSAVVFSAGVAYVGAQASSLTRRFGRGAYRSTDGGVTWDASSPNGLYVETFARSEDGTLLAGTDDGLYESTDGLVWEPAGLNEPPHQVAAVLPGEGDEPAFLGTGRGVYRAGGAAGWERVNKGFERGLVVDAVAVDGEALFASANGEVYWYDAAAGHWRLPENEGLRTDGRAFTLVLYGGALLLGTRHGLFRTGDVGETWEALWLVGGGEERFATLGVTSAGTLVLGTVYSSSVVQLGQLFFSFDEGATWVVSEGWNDSPAGIPYAIEETSSGTLLVAAIAGKFNPSEVYRSSDGGTSWTGRGGDGVYDLAATPTGTIMGVGSGGHYRSLDDGLTWEQTESTGGFGIIAAPNGGLAAIRDPNFYYIRDVYYSVDEGLSWTQVISDLPASALATDAESFVYAGTARRGVWRSAAPLFVSGEAGPGTPHSFALAPGYPNPLVSSTSVPFSLSKAGPVTVTVHDVLGRRVATLVDRVLPAGEYTATWESSDAASGVYVVTLHAGDRVATQRITVAR